MPALNPLRLTIRRGASERVPIRRESPQLAYATITAITQTAPVRITATAHGIPDGWRAACMNVRGMTDINAELGADGLPKDRALQRVTVIDADTVEFNKVNAAGFRAYASGGQLAYYAPSSLGGYVSARMDVKNKVGGTVLASFNTSDGTLEIDAGSDAVFLVLTPAQSILLAAGEPVFDIELLQADGSVDPICSAESILTVLPEVTTTE